MTDEQWGAARKRFSELARLRNTSHKLDLDPASQLALQGFNALVGEWEQEGVAQDILLPLLQSADPPVRYTAASFLLRMGLVDEALEVLRELENIGTYSAAEIERYHDSAGSGRDKRKEI